MQRYSDVDRDSGVVAYETGADFIRIKFSDGTVYLYTYSSAGTHHIERMKALAMRGDGLNAYINEHVRKAYARKEK
ncbi:MAG TPA: hypothetical protein ENJ80_12925 [Gammaproteobacteria bacterium]|nr:hypothetical protein [Gammaproteobacteria bacterium]